jgi:GT2 family glycosyltransferase
MASPIGSSVCVVTVTYGDREHLLREVLMSLLEQTAIRRIIVVNNGALWNVPALAGELGPDRVDVVELPSNRGSGAGFTAGIKRACEFGADFIWLLDDDNKPEPGALSQLLAAHAHLRARYSEDDLAVVALRPVLEGRISSGLLPTRMSDRPSSFWSFHVFDLPHKIWCRMPGGRPQAVTELPPLIEAEVGPYGGLLFHRAVVEKYGFPRQDFVLYRDDLEFTYRITRGGGALRLVTSAIIIDLDQPWHAGHQFENSFQAWLDRGSSDMRVFYEARNRAYMDTHCFPHNRLMYWVNRRVYCFFLWIFALVFQRTDRYRLLRSAIADGIAERLDMAPRFPLL